MDTSQPFRPPFTLTPDLARALMSSHVCGRPNRYSEPCQLRTMNGAPCAFHAKKEAGDVRGFIEEIVSITNQRHREAAQRHEQWKAEWHEEEEKRVVEAKALIEELERDEIEALLSGPRRCNRPTASGTKCALNAESYAPGCKWHMTPWERNTNRIAERAWMRGYEAGKSRSEE